MLGSITGNGTVDTGYLQKEVDTLEELSRQLFLEIVDLHNTKLRQNAIVEVIARRVLPFSWTYIFSILHLEIFISTVNLIFDRVGKTDPVTRGIEITVNYLGWKFDVIFWSQHISFFLIGILIVTS